MTKPVFEMHAAPVRLDADEELDYIRARADGLAQTRMCSIICGRQPRDKMDDPEWLIVLDMTARFSITVRPMSFEYRRAGDLTTADLYSGGCANPDLAQYLESRALVADDIVTIAAFDARQIVIHERATLERIHHTPHIPAAFRLS